MTAIRRSFRFRKAHSAHVKRLAAEQLEERRLLAHLTVDTELDVVDPSDHLTSLREAIATANTTPGADDINFDFGHDGPAVILLEQGELEITETLTITGDGPDLITIDAQQQSRIFNIIAETGDFGFEGMTLTGGRVAGDNANFDDNTFNGGAIRSLTTGSLSFQNGVIGGNSVTGDAAQGGGVFALGDVTLNDSTLSGNIGGEENSIPIPVAPFNGGRGGAVSARGVTVTSSAILDNSVANNTSTAAAVQFTPSM